jgi:hypothetical protein
MIELAPEESGGEFLLDIVWGQTFTINQEGGSICDIR